jgi:diguanylate cyclase (GGDEF)-like protein
VAARPRRLLPPAHPPRPHTLKPLGLRLLPGAVLLAATVALLVVPALAPLAASLLPAYPSVVLLAGALLAWRFRRWRVLVATLMLAAAERVLAVTLASSTPAAHVVTAAAAAALPLNLTALTWLHERGRAVLGWSLGLVAAEALATALLAQPEAAPVAETLAYRLGPGVGLPFVGLLAFAGALALAALRFVVRPQALECGTFWALLAALLAFGAGSPAPASIALGGAGLILLVSLIEASHAIAYGDELTGLPSRRALSETLARLEGVYTIAMVDIDHFKVFNDTYGHDAGDQLLRMVGARLAEVGGGGRPFRYGGEEFAVIFIGTPLEDARPHLEELCHRIEATGFGIRGPDRPRSRAEAPRAAQAARRASVSVSIGAAEAARAEAPAQEVLDAADAALYRAKRSGRNRVCT